MGRVGQPTLIYIGEQFEEHAADIENNWSSERRADNIEARRGSLKGHSVVYRDTSSIEVCIQWPQRKGSGCTS